MKRLLLLCLLSIGLFLTESVLAAPFEKDVANLEVSSDISISVDAIALEASAVYAISHVAYMQTFHVETLLASTESLILSVSDNDDPGDSKEKCFNLDLEGASKITAPLPKARFVKAVDYFKMPKLMKASYNLERPGRSSRC